MIYCYWQANDLAHAKTQIFVINVDLEDPISGSVCLNEETYNITLGSDNFGASYYYRINFGEWILYDKNVEVDSDGVFVIETMAKDLAMNESYQIYKVDSNEYVPNVEGIRGEFDSLINTNILVNVYQYENFDTYYYLNDVCYPVKDMVEVLIDDSNINSFYTKVIDDQQNEHISNIYRVNIDKTAPVCGDILFEYLEVEDFSVNAYYGYAGIDLNEIYDDNKFDVYYKIEEIGSTWHNYERGIPIHNYLVDISGIFTLAIKVVDAAGNEMIVRRYIKVDGEAPVIEDVSIDRILDEENKSTDYILNIGNIYDHVSYCNGYGLSLWDMNGYENGADPIILLEEYIDEGISSFTYDFSFLPDGQSYYFVFSVQDIFGNIKRSLLYTFYKYNLATTVNIDGYLFEQLDGEYYLFKYEGNETDLVLPDSVNGSHYYVASNFMLGDTNITSLKINSGVIGINTSAFSYCPNLKSVDLGDSLKYLGLNTFMNCSKLDSIILSDSLESVDNFVFDGISDHVSVNVLDNVKYLGSANNPYLFVYSYYDNGSKEVSINENAKFIRSFAFFNTKITKVYIPDSVTFICSGAFSDCSYLTEVRLSQSISQIYASTFENCKSLEYIDLHNGITHIWDNAFYGCSSLKEMILPDSLHYIGGYSFYGCISLSKICLNNNIKTISIHSFSGCSGVKELYYDIIDGLSFDFYANPFAGDDGSDFGVAGFSLVIGKSVKVIPTYIFKNLKYLNNIVFEEGSSLEVIEECAFRGCLNLTDIEIPEGVKYIGNWAFVETGIRNISIPNSIEMVLDLGLDVEDVNANIYNNGYYIGNARNPYLILLDVVLGTKEVTVHEDTIGIHQFYFMDLEYIYIPENVRFITQMDSSYINYGVFEDSSNWYWYNTDIIVDFNDFDYNYCYQPIIKK